MHLLFFGLVNMNYDKIINPITGKFIEKYERTWYYLIRKGYDEAFLESLPVHQPVKPIVTKAKNIDLLNTRPSRGGVILYCIKANIMYFGFGVDTRYNELSDLSGGLKYKKDQNAIRGALRELKEESLELYNMTESDVQESVTIYDKHNLIIFLKIYDDPIEITQKFQERYQTATNSEISAIVWLTQLDMKMVIKYSNTPIHPSIIMYERVRKLLDKADNFYRFL